MIYAEDIYLLTLPSIIFISRVAVRYTQTMNNIEMFSNYARFE